jgi:nitrogen fixation/metabolism regulation signal transduction histidine kinase
LTLSFKASYNAGVARYKQVNNFKDFWYFFKRVMIIGDAVSFIGLLFGVMGKLQSIQQNARFTIFFAANIITVGLIFLFFVVITVIYFIARYASSGHL